MIVVTSIFHEGNKYYPQVFLVFTCWIVYKCQEYDRIDVPDEIDVYKINELPMCIICNYYSKYYIFIKINFIFQSKACDGCHDFTQKAISFNDIATAALKEIIIDFIFGMDV